MRILVVKADKSNKDAVMKEVEMMTSQMQKMANELGYELCHPFWKDDELRLWFRPLNMTGYYPDINVDTGLFGNATTEKPRFTIQTVAYGALEVAEYQKFVEATQNAYKLAEYFNSKELGWLKDYFPTIEFEKEN